MTPQERAPSGAPAPSEAAQPRLSAMAPATADRRGTRAPDVGASASLASSSGFTWWPQPPADRDIYVSLTLDIEPVPKDRHRTSAAEYTEIGGRRIKTKKAHSYTTRRLAKYEETVGWLLLRAGVKRNESDDLGVRAVFHVRSETADIDNLAKSLFDACNSVAWHDDRQVTQLAADVVRGSSDPRIELTIYVVQRRAAEAGAA